MELGALIVKSAKQTQLAQERHRTFYWKMHRFFASTFPSILNEYSFLASIYHFSNFFCTCCRILQKLPLSHEPHSLPLLKFYPFIPWYIPKKKNSGNTVTDLSMFILKTAFFLNIAFFLHYLSFIALSRNLNVIDTCNENHRRSKIFFWP